MQLRTLASACVRPRRSRYREKQEQHVEPGIHVFSGWSITSKTHSSVTRLYVR